MRIAWASPINAQSAIGRVSADVVGELVGRGHEVKVISTEWDTDHPAHHAVPAEIIDWRDLSGRDLAADFDILVANVGDHFLYHGGLFSLFGRLPTLGVFHDFYLYDLFNGWLWSGGQRSPAESDAAHRAAILMTYGPEALSTAASARAGGLSITEIASKLPMTEWIASQCDGALAHADFYVDRLLAACPGPVGRGYMPVTGRGIPALATKVAGRLNVITVGVMNPNKCVTEVLKAIISSPELSEVINYHLVGPIEDSEAKRLKALAASAGYSNLVVHGTVSDENLAAQLTAADIVCCLRRPVLEGCSGSAIEALLAGRPMVVADAGFYAELPADVVSKIGEDIPLDALVNELRRLAEDEPLRRQRGEAGRSWAQRRFTLDAYARSLEALAEDVLQARPALAMATGLGAGLSALGLDRDDPAVGRIGAVLADIFPSSAAE